MAPERQMRVLTAGLWLLLAAVAAAGAQTRTLNVRVVKVVDGDTLEVLDSNRLQHRVRLAGIDAPEKNQAFTDRSREHLAQRVAGRDVRIEWSKEDRYGRFVAVVWLAAAGECPAPACRNGNLDVNLLQVLGGYAWHYKHYEEEQSREDRAAYARAELDARAAALGLWKDAAPTPPWDFRAAPASGPVKKSRSDICHAPDMPTYGLVLNFESFPTLQDCIDSGGRLPRNIAR